MSEKAVISSVSASLYFSLSLSLSLLSALCEETKKYKGLNTGSKWERKVYP